MRFKHHWTLALAALLVAGCGGGSGSGSSGTTTTADARVSLFITDDLGSYDHVWVTIRSIVLIGTDGSKTLYQDDTGTQVDLAALHSGKESVFAFLGLGKVKAGDYTGVQVTLDPSLVLFPAGATTGLTRTFAGAANGVAVLSETLSGSGGHLKGGGPLVVDFDLKNWTDDGTTVTAAIKPGPTAGLGDPGHQHGQDYRGTVSALTASGFTLTPPHGDPIAVTLTSDTTVFGSATRLADGQTVSVRGTFSTTTSTLAATSVEVGSGSAGGPPPPGVMGKVASVGTETFDLTTGGCGGFLPTTSTVHVTYTSAPPSKVTRARRWTRRASPPCWRPARRSRPRGRTTRPRPRSPRPGSSSTSATTRTPSVA